MATFIFYLVFLLWVLASVLVILVVLLQSGKGGGLSGLVGSGSALGDHLGATGAEKTLNRWTSYCAVGFLLLNIVLVLMGGRILNKNLLEKVPATSASRTAAPAAAPQAPGTAPQPPAASPAAPVQAPAPAK